MLSLNTFSLLLCVVLLSTANAGSLNLSRSLGSYKGDCGSSDHPAHSDYKNYGTDHCYKLHDEFVSWNEAKTKCEQELGYLAVIKDTEEAKLINEIISAQSGWARTWVGIRDYGNNDWRSVNGDKLYKIYHKWVSTATFKNKCGSITNTSELEDMPCDTEKLPFMCELDYDFFDLNA